jgi:hypothetical protein
MEWDGLSRRLRVQSFSADSLGSRVQKATLLTPGIVRWARDLPVVVVGGDVIGRLALRTLSVFVRVWLCEAVIRDR